MDADKISPTAVKGLRIGLVGPLPPPAGGMANQTRQLGALLQQEGATVELVQTNPPYPAWIANFRWVRAPFRLFPYFINLWCVAGKVQLLHVMANSGWSWHFFAAPAIWVAKLRSIPVVVNYRGGGAEAFFARSFFLVRPSLRRADAVVVPSRFLEQVFAKRGIAAGIVPNIIDLARFSRHGAADRVTTDRPPHIVVTRNLERIYDIGTALRAFAIFRLRFPEARLTVAGSGLERERLEALAAGLGLSDAVIFTGQLDNAEMANLYRAATIALNPSRVDNMPISVLEALASGVPVVSTNVGGVPHLVQDGQTALLVQPGSPEPMAEAMGRIAADKILARRLSEAGSAAVQAYAWANVRDRLVEVYACVTTGAQRAAPADAK